MLSTVIVWGFRYPPGIDLPQHAHLFGVLAHFHDPVLGVGAFYDLQPLTPYLLTYVVGALLAKVLGALVATKVLLFSIALLTPYALLRWLAAVGGEESFAFWGFVLAFWLPFRLGVHLLRRCAAGGLLLPGGVGAGATGRAIWRALQLAGLLVALFFTHGATFVVVATALGLSTLLQPRVAFCAGPVDSSSRSSSA